MIRVRKLLRKVDQDGRKVFRLGDLKTDRSARTETMPADVATDLAAHKRAQAKDRLRHGQDYGSGLDDCAEGLAFSGQCGQALHHQSVLKAGEGQVRGCRARPGLGSP